MDYKEILRRYYSGATTLDEERALREHLPTNKPTASAEQMATQAIMDYAAEIRHEQVGIRLHHAAPRRIWGIASALAVCALIIVCGIKLLQPEIYGYHNGRPITSLEEAEFYSRQLFAELAVTDHDLHNEDLLKDMFKLE